MSKIVRTPTRAEGGITPEEKARMDTIAQKWIGVALRTDPIEPEKIVPAVKALYNAAGLECKRVVITPSPLVMAMAYGAAAWIWHCRKQGDATHNATRVATHNATYNATRDATATATDAATDAATATATDAATSDAIRDATAATYVAIRDATRSAIRSAIRDATRAATDAATRAATRAATYVATSAATYNATDDATFAATSAAIDAATDAATRAATFAATDVATYVATSAATSAATFAATDVATSAATDVATRAATDVATYVATDVATNAATRAATRAATDVATYVATYVATSAATRAATRAATDVATDAATDVATDVATNAATRAATSAATFAAIDVATNAATRAATSAATFAATFAAIDAATDAATDVATDATKACFDLAGSGGLLCAQRWYASCQGGNMWAAFPAYVEAAREVLGLQLPQFATYQSWEDCTLHGSFRVLHEEFCIVSDFPLQIHKDAQNRPHNDNGPSHEWRDGWKLWHIHGVRVDEQIVMRPETLTAAQIDAEQNAEIRRVMIERFGAERYLLESGAEPVQRDAYGVLYRREVQDDEAIVMVRLLNSTPEPDGVLTQSEAESIFGEQPVRTRLETMQALGHAIEGEPRFKAYMLRVPPTIRTAHEAVAWTFGKEVGSYAPQIES